MSYIQGVEDQTGHGSQAEPGSGLPSYIEGGVIEEPGAQRAYILSGERPGSSLRFTLENTRTGRHFTYQVEVARGPVAAGDGRRRFVSVLTGGDNERTYTYLGTIFEKGGRGVHWPGGLTGKPGGRYFHPDRGGYVWTRQPYYQGKKSTIGKGAPSALAFRWLWAHLTERISVGPWLSTGKAGFLPISVRFWHEGRCGRCGRTLTDPESIKRGLGPVCVGS